MAGNSSSNGATLSASDISVRLDGLDAKMVNLNKEVSQIGKLFKIFFDNCNVKNGSNVVENYNNGCGYGDAVDSSAISNWDQVCINVWRVN